MSFSSDKRYGRQGGRLIDPGDDRSIADIKAAHLATPPAGCSCLWCTEGSDDSPQLDLFGGDT